ncbi:MAG TPA: LytTR family DNA-binding domain-containing protein [Chitinophagaceae bacterium]|nr:LytTR family DNA-binding domain-containing protein [Chitinophagaceae bacterium]HEX5652800.1 LytTR family DNA-binding domain-containing protein [Chitinophagaceae bacterium]
MPETKTIRCLVVDDEPPAREIIRRYIEQVPTLELAGECANAIQAFTILQQQTVDLVFLDIRMPELNGNDFLKTLKNPPKVIFTTAYTEYALEGYELDVVDYLMKPIPFDRFLKAVNKAYQLAIQRPEALALPEEKKSESFVYFRADRKMVKVMLQDILYIESMKDYVKICTVNGTIITKQSISSVEEMLPEKEFVRVHRSYIASLQKIKTFTAELIEFDSAEIPIGKLYRHAVLKMLGQLS